MLACAWLWGHLEECPYVGTEKQCVSCEGTQQQLAGNCTVEDVKWVQGEFAYE